jgi:hypothetical protein
MLLGATEARAQWDAPSFFAPRTGDDIGVYISDPGSADLGLQGIWRQSGTLNVGVRVGYVDVADESIITVGTETWVFLKGRTESFPVDVALTFGAGASFNGGTTGEVPLGFSIGRSADLGPIQAQVYTHPRIAAVFYLDASDDQDELQFDAALDVGLDLTLARVLKLRVGATVGDFDAVGVGIAYRWRRGE